MSRLDMTPIWADIMVGGSPMRRLCKWSLLHFGSATMGANRRNVSSSTARHLLSLPKSSSYSQNGLLGFLVTSRTSSNARSWASGLVASSSMVKAKVLAAVSWPTKFMTNMLLWISFVVMFGRCSFRLSVLFLGCVERVRRRPWNDLCQTLPFRMNIFPHLACVSSILWSRQRFYQVASTTWARRADAAPEKESAWAVTRDLTLSAVRHDKSAPQMRQIE